MSKIVSFRQRVIDSISDQVTQLRSVDWYDGLFDEGDLKEWVVDAPCAMVSVFNVPKAEHHSTRELNLDLRCVVVVITADEREPRSADAQVWEIMEEIVVLANLNTFGDPNAGPSTDLQFKRLRDPELRREGVALGVVEWSSGLTIGYDHVRDVEFYHHPVTGAILNFNPHEFLGKATVKKPIDLESEETLDLSPPDPACLTDEDS